MKSNFLARTRQLGRKTVAGLDYLRIGLREPRLLLSAARHVLRIRGRFLFGRLRARRARVTGAVGESLRFPTPHDLMTLLSANTGVLLLYTDPRIIRVGMQDVDVPAALTSLSQACPAGRLTADGIDVASRDAAPLRNAQLIAFLIPNGTRIEIEIYQRRAPQFWLSQNRSNRLARGLYEDILEQDGIHPLSRILPAPTLEQKLQQTEIDLVYTWVDHRDPDWAAAFARHRALSNPAAHGQPIRDDATSMARFHSNDELRYSLRSVSTNLPWVRSIYILSNCAAPSWLARNERITWVPHSEIIPARYLPTFSSHVIESYLHHIPGLSEHFIYMNDDFFVTTPQDKSFFFAGTGHSRAFLEDEGVVSGAVRSGDPAYLNAARNSARLLLQEFDLWPTRLHRHSPYALNRDLLWEIEDRWLQEFARFRSEKFRSSRDLNLTSFLYHHYALMTGRAETADVRLSLVSPHDVRWFNRLRTGLADCEMLCINEGGAMPQGQKWHDTIRRFLEQNFPQKAVWEK